MINNKLQNLKSLQAKTTSLSYLFLDSFIDVASKQIVFSNASKS